MILSKKKKSIKKISQKKKYQSKKHFFYDLLGCHEKHMDTFWL